MSIRWGHGKDHRMVLPERCLASGLERACWASLEGGGSCLLSHPRGHVAG